MTKAIVSRNECKRWAWAARGIPNRELYPRRWQADRVFGTGAAAAIHGILSEHVTECEVGTIGNTSTVSPIGIEATSVSNSRVESIGSNNANTTYGIFGTRALVTGCRVEQCSAAGDCFCIAGGLVQQCYVTTISQTGTSSVATGISAEEATDCVVNTVSAAAGSIPSGYSGYLVASRCRSTNVAGGTNNAACFRPGAGSTLTIDCQINGGSADFGVDLNSLNPIGAVVRGCRIVLGGTGTGILCVGTRNRIDGNTVSNAIIGISAPSSSSGGLMVHNRVTDCTTPISYNASGTWQVAAIITATGSFSTSNAWANFTD